MVLSLGDTYKEDTTQATTDQIDQRANELCGAPYTNASVWFSYTPKDTGTFLVDMSQSDYEGGFMVFKQKPQPGDLLACGPEQVALKGKAGTTYLIMAFSDTPTNGGNLVLQLEQGPPPPTVSATINAKGTLLPKGKAEVSGTFTCTNAQVLEVDGQLRQIWQRVKINGYFTSFQQGDNICDGKSHTWSRVVTSHNGFYAAGDATVRISAVACGLLDCKATQSRQHVTLAKGKHTAVSGSSVMGGVGHALVPLTSRHWPSAA